jgi:AraC-like DNA-binding protein
MPKRPEEILTLSDLPSLMGVTPPRTMEDFVRAALRTQLVQGDLSIDSVACHLSIGPRTLQRRLRLEGTSFREVKERFVKERAQALLSGSDLSMDAIARSVGYSEPNNFGRAFRNWTGLSPSSYRSAIGGR